MDVWVTGHDTTIPSDASVAFWVISAIFSGTRNASGSYATDIYMTRMELITGSSRTRPTRATMARTPSSYWFVTQRGTTWKRFTFAQLAERLMTPMPFNLET